MTTIKTLWSDITRTRHFLISDSESLPAGEFVLRTVTGRQQEVDPQALATYEISREQAETWLKDQFTQVVESTKASIMDSIRGKMAQEPDLDAWFGQRSDESSPTLNKSTDSTALLLLAALSGESYDRLRSEPQSVGRAIRTLIAQVGAVFSDATSSDEARVEAARQRIKALRGTLRQHGLHVGEAMENFPDTLRDAYQSAERDLGSANAADRLESLAAGIEETAARAVEWLRDQAREIRHQQNQVQTAEKTEKQLEKMETASDERS